MSGQYQKKMQIISMLSILMVLLSLSFIQFPLTTLLKPLPLVFFILLGLENKNPATKKLLLTALGFSLFGDIALTLPINLALHIAIAAFIIVQCAYMLLFLKNAEFQNKHLGVFLVALVVVTLGFYYLYPYLDDMKIPIMVYSGWLICMMFCALHVKQQNAVISIGAFLFLFSDIVFAINQFIFLDDKFIGILVMYLYYAAQFLFLLGILESKNITESKLSSLATAM